MLKRAVALLAAAVVAHSACAFVAPSSAVRGSVRPHRFAQQQSPLNPLRASTTVVLAGGQDNDDLLNAPSEEDLLKPDFEFDAITLGLLFGGALAFQFFVLANL